MSYRPSQSDASFQAKYSKFVYWLILGSVQGLISYAVTANDGSGHPLNWPLFPFYVRWIETNSTIPDIAFPLFMFPAMILNGLIWSLFAVWIYGLVTSRISRSK